jgi:MFS transporter, SP family, general alpha glucoside:H+ symporter
MAPNQAKSVDTVNLNEVEQFHNFDTINVNEITTSHGLDSAAQIATENEHNLGFREALQRYPTAAFWAIAMCFTIVMEGYDAFLIGNFYAYPQFKQKYGTYDPHLDQWVIDAR